MKSLKLQVTSSRSRVVLCFYVITRQPSCNSPSVAFGSHVSRLSTLNINNMYSDLLTLLGMYYESTGSGLNIYFFCWITDIQSVHTPYKSMF